MPTPNAEMIRKTVKAIERHKNNWYQRKYIRLPAEADKLCGTTLCFAGFAVRLHLGREAFRKAVLEIRPNGQVWEKFYPWSTKAAEILGLDNDTAYEIFHFYTNDVEELKRFITSKTGVTFD